MSNPAGSFVWYELMTPNPDAVKGFYRDVAGLTIGDAAPMPDGKDYRMLGRPDGKHTGGVLALSADMVAHGAHPTWLAYLSADDTDATVAAIVADGGKLLMPAMNLPVGRIAMVTDPQGVPFYVMTPIPPAGMPDLTSDVFSPTGVGHVSWNELASPDLAAAKQFYAKHFGFEFKESMNMGPMGDYCFIDHHGQRLGAIMQRASERQPKAWLFYIRVPSVTAAAAAIKAGGGQVIVGPVPVPANDWIAVAIDPAGAGFGVVGPKGDD